MKMLSLWSSANQRRYNSVRYYIIEVMDLQYILNFVFPFFKIFYKLVIAAGTSKRAKRTGKSTGGKRSFSPAACWGFYIILSDNYFFFFFIVTITAAPATAITAITTTTITTVLLLPEDVISL